MQHLLLMHACDDMRTDRRHMTCMSNAASSGSTVKIICRRSQLWSAIMSWLAKIWLYTACMCSNRTACMLTYQTWCLTGHSIVKCRSYMLGAAVQMRPNLLHEKSWHCTKLIPHSSWLGIMYHVYSTTSRSRSWDVTKPDSARYSFAAGIWTLLTVII